MSSISSEVECMGLGYKMARPFGDGRKEVVANESATVCFHYSTFLQLTEPGRLGRPSPVVTTSVARERRTGHGHAQIRRPQTAAKCVWETISKVKLARGRVWVRAY